MIILVVKPPLQVVGLNVRQVIRNKTTAKLSTDSRTRQINLRIKYWRVIVKVENDVGVVSACGRHVNTDPPLIVQISRHCDSAI